MCGRYTLSVRHEVLAEKFGVSGPLPELSPSYNVAPGREVPAVVGEADGDGGNYRRRMEMLRWGLIPPWADDPAIGYRMINARAETAPSKPSFRRAFRKRRCLIPADGFYEWKKENGGKQPYHFRLKDGESFAFAGIWESWTDPDGGTVRSCAILTTEANEVVGEVHARMPVILPPEDHYIWLDPDFEETEPLAALLVPYPPEALEAYPVSRFVNRPGNDDERCVERVA